MSHLKSMSAPKAWPIKRKHTMFTTRPSPGPRKMEEAVPLNFLLKHILSLTKTTRETKKALATKNVLVNTFPRKDHRFPVGLLDTIFIQPTKEQYIVVFSPSGKLTAQKMKSPLEGRFAKVVGKTIIKGKKIQLNLHDGTNLLVDKDNYQTGDTLIIEKNKIKKHLKNEKGALIYLTSGKHKGKTGTLEEVKIAKEMQKNRIVFKADKHKFETLQEFAFVIDKQF